MTDSQLIQFLEASESTVSPTTDDRGILTGWVAHCAPLLVTAAGTTLRESVENLRKEMEGAC